MTLSRLEALTKRWKVTPPAVLQLARISSFLGIKDSSEEGKDPRAQAARAGIPMMEGKLPDDPYIGFLDDKIGLGQGLH